MKLGPVDLSQAQEIRLERLMPKAILRAGQSRLFVPLPPGGGLLRRLLDFLADMWPPPPEASPPQAGGKMPNPAEPGPTEE